MRRGPTARDDEETAVKYVFLLANAPDAWEDPDPAPEGVDDGVFDDWATYSRALAAAGVLVGGAALHDPGTATTVQVRGGRRLLVDGPFTETKEHLLGYYVVDVPDLDTALEWAAKVPNARTGSVEVRPVVAGSETDAVLAGGAAPA